MRAANVVQSTGGDRALGAWRLTLAGRRAAISGAGASGPPQGEGDAGTWQIYMAEDSQIGDKWSPGAYNSVKQASLSSPWPPEWRGRWRNEALALTDERSGHTTHRRVGQASF